MPGSMTLDLRIRLPGWLLHDFKSSTSSGKQQVLVLIKQKISTNIAQHACLTLRNQHPSVHSQPYQPRGHPEEGRGVRRREEHSSLETSGNETRGRHGKPGFPGPARQRYFQGRRRARCRHRARRNGRYRNDIRGPASKDPEDDRSSPGCGGNEYGWQGGVAGGPEDQVRRVQFYGDELSAELCSPELLLSRRDGL